MSFQWLEKLLSDGFERESFLELAGRLTGDKLGDLIEDRVDFPTSIKDHSQPFVFRGSKKGPDSIGIYAIKINKSTLKKGFKTRRQLANMILNINNHNDALVAFYAEGDARWRLGFVRGYKFDALESLREFHLGEGLAIRTAREQLEPACNMSYSTELGERSVALNKVFSIEAISDNFYDEFKKLHFDKIVSSIVSQGEEKQRAEDLAVLFTIRVMFLGFVQKKGWLSDDTEFLQHLLKSYEGNNSKDGFYAHWLKPLFFEALNGFSNNIESRVLPEDTKKKYRMLPYLNGGLFHLHDVDKREFSIGDEVIANFFTFLFSYNFTIEENTLQEQSLELNPELLGIIFERLVNKQNGAVYTPRTEVDFMCRISLVKWLQQNLVDDNRPDDRDLFELFFREKGGGKEFDNDQKKGSFSLNQNEAIRSKLKSITVCDPAVGSGAFPVGMMHVLNEALENLGENDSILNRYSRKKHIIGKNLYGVEVNEWAVWICQLRLWLSLFIDAPDELKDSHEPILPSLDFKILQGDSIVQTIGDAIIPIEGHVAIDSSLRKKVASLQKLKVDFYNNKLPSTVTISMIHGAEVEVMRSILSEQKVAKQRDLQILRQREIVSQQSLLEDEPEHIIQQSLGDIEEMTYVEEINRLDELLNNLSTKPKTVWSISFAEVFADKGGFDIVIGNPPYVVVEDIVDPQDNYDPLTYKSLLAEVIRNDYYPTLNTNKFKRLSGFNGNSDLYIYFYMHSLKLLNKNGIHTFICSNSWLDTGFAAWFQSYILKNIDVHGIYESRVKKSFASADINTLISVMGAPKHKKLINTDIKFVSLDTSFEKAIITENLLNIENSKILTKTSEYRVYPVSREKISTESTVDGKFIGDKWGGKYLRSPDILVSLLNKGEWTLNSIVNKERYLNTGGADGFFIITNFVEDESCYHIINNKVSESGLPFDGLVEKKFFKPLVKDYLKTHKNIGIENYDALCFVPSNEEVLSPLALEYIKWGELNGYNKKSVTKLTNPWYKPTRQMMLGASVVIPRSYSDTYLSYSNPTKLLTLRYYRLHIKDESVSVENLTAFMNSTLYWLYLNALGNQSQGQGVLDVNMDDLVAKYHFPKIDLTHLELPNQLSNRRINNIFVECGINPEDQNLSIEEQIPKPLEDRAILDNKIFDALGLSDEERNDIYRGTCRLTWNRLNKAQSI